MEPAELKSIDVEGRASRDMAAEAAANVERIVGVVRKFSTSRVEFVARAIVYGIVAGFLGLVAFVIVLIGAFRLTNNYLPPSDSSWSAWLLFGVVFLVVGLVAWSKRGRIGPTAT